MPIWQDNKTTITTRYQRKEPCRIAKARCDTFVAPAIMYRQQATKAQEPKLAPRHLFPLYQINLPKDFQPCYSRCTSSLLTSLSPASSSHSPTSHPTTPSSLETPSRPSQFVHRSRPERKMMPAASSPHHRHPSIAMLRASAPTFASEVHETPWRRSLEEIEPCLSLPCGR